MKNIVSIFSLLLVLLVVFSGCGTETQIEDNDNNEVSNNIQTNNEHHTHNQATENDDVKVLVECQDWNSFTNNLTNGEVMVNSLSTVKNNIMTHKIELSGYTTSSINYIEYNPQEDSQISDWEFNVYWVNDNTDEIRHHLYYCANGVDEVAATKGYTPLDSQAGVYVKNINNGKTAYVCLINSKMFMRIVIQDDCANYDELSQQLINYAMEVKDIANPGDIK